MQDEPKRGEIWIYTPSVKPARVVDAGREYNAGEVMLILQCPWYGKRVRKQTLDRAHVRFFMAGKERKWLLKNFMGLAKRTE